MAKAKSVTIKLTPKQRAALKSLTGEEHAAVMFEGTRKALSAKLAPTVISPRPGHPGGRWVETV